jgi:hypothetical protein
MDLGAIHSTARDAWTHLVKHGGLELGGRDQGLDDSIRHRLAPSSKTIKEALDKATLEAFTRAFFESVHPYLEIVQGILALFVKAGALEGPNQWNLRVGDVDLQLEHFRRWIEEWSGVPARLQVPAIDRDSVWEIPGALRTASQFGMEMENRPAPSNQALPHDVKRWLDEYSAGNYAALPTSLDPARCPEPLRRAASMVVALLTRVRELGHTRDDLWAAFRSELPVEESDYLAPGTVAQNETDELLSTLLTSVASACQLPQDELNAAATRLQDVLQRFPDRPFDADISLAHLDSILSLPIWKQRYELFAVWVACEMIEALEGHTYIVHHDEGRMTFSFKETRVASVSSSAPRVELISEKRSRLDKPKGHGRVENVQPDFGIWTVSSPTCKLVVECKHYKKAANRRFAHTVDDYARALPSAEVFLVNYGPIGDFSSNIDDKRLLQRCHAIEHLTPSNWRARTKLREAVRKCVGEPVVQLSRDGTVLAVDVSFSMDPTLQNPETRDLLRRLIEDHQVEAIVALDEHVLQRWKTDDQSLEELLTTRGGSTELSHPVEQLLSEADRVLIVTDDEGANTLQSVDTMELFPPEASRVAARILVCVQTASLT